MMDKNEDYIDELNWYTGDFVDEPKKEKRVKHHHSGGDGGKQSGAQGDTSNRTSGLIDVLENQQKKSESASLFKRPDAKSVGNSVLSRMRSDIPRRKSEGLSVLNKVDNDSFIKKPTGVSVFNKQETDILFKKSASSSVFKTVEKKSRSRDTDIYEVPARKIKLDKPDPELLSTYKIINKSKENNPVLFAPLKPAPKKSEFIEPPSRVVELVKMPEPISNFVKAPVNTKAVQILTEKLALLEERDKLIRASMEKPSNLKQAIAIKGTCPDMCPEKERIMRSLKKMVSVFECAPNSNEMDPQLAVKDYTRSSADQEEPLPHELRPEPVLTMTMSYIITKIISEFEQCEDVSVWYDFCWNRLRAVRKDIVQQQLCDVETATILEQCARFHIVCFDRFWGLDSSIFDEKINTENLMNCLKILTNLYGDLRKKGVQCPNEPEFTAYMILIKMNSGDILWEFLNFPLSLQQTPEVIEAVRIHMFYNSSMYSQFFNYLNKTTYLNACLMQRCFTLLRVRALEAIVKAYCPPGKEGKVSLQHIMKSLKFDNKEDALAFCKTCNIKYIERSGFKISHVTFVRPETPMKVVTPSSLVCNKRVEFAQAVVGMYNDMPVYSEHKVHNSFINDSTLNPDSLDASDQEEKMLRDNVKRKLLLKNLKSTSVKDISLSQPSTPSLQRSLSSLSNHRKSMDSDTSTVTMSDKPIEKPYTPEPEDIEMDDMSESEDYDLADAATAFAEAAKSIDNIVRESQYTDDYKDSDDDTNQVNVESDSELPSELNSDRLSPLSVISQESEEELRLEEPSKSPILEYPKKISPLPETNQLYIPSTNISKTDLAEAQVSPINVPSKPSDTSQSKTLQTVSPTQSKPERRLSVSSQKDSRINPYITKLKFKIQQNLQRISAKKYGRIWREKVREIRKSYGFIPLVSHMNLKEYLTTWGHSLTKHNSIWNHLDRTKQLSSSVESLLLFNLFDTSVKRLAQSVSEALVEKRSRSSRIFSCFDNSLCGPIYWKLVFSVPSSKVSTYNLYEEINSWSEEVFFTTELARNTRIETTVCKGIKVYCKVDVVEGYDRLDSGKNLSALILLRVPGWETKHESQQRLNKLLSFSNHPVSVCIINLTSCQPLTPPVNQLVLHMSQITAGSIKFPSILTTLASNSYQLTVKTFHICDLMSELIDRFLDSLHEDCYNNEDFKTSLTDPSRIVYLYNVFIDKIKNEIINNYKSNIFGTANEIISSITPNSKYNINSLSSILSNYFDSLILIKLQWPPVDSKNVLFILKNYCEKSGIPQTLSHVIRMINPPDTDDQGEKLSEFLSRLNWLQIMEIVIKGYFRTKFCDVIVTYSEKSVNNFIDSHWWMEYGLT